MTINDTIGAALNDTKNADWVDLNDWAVNTIREIADKMGWSRGQTSDYLRQEIAFQSHNSIPHTYEGLQAAFRLRRAHTLCLAMKMARTPRLFKKAAFVVWVSRRQLGY